MFQVPPWVNHTCAHLHSYIWPLSCIWPESTRNPLWDGVSLPVPHATRCPLSHTCCKRMSQKLKLERGSLWICSWKKVLATNLWYTFHNDCVALCTQGWQTLLMGQCPADLSRDHSSCILHSVHKCCTAGKPVMLQVWESAMPPPCVKASLQSRA